MRVGIIVSICKICLGVPLGLLMDVSGIQVGHIALEVSQCCWEIPYF